MQYGHQQLADSLPQVPQERIANETSEKDVTATGSSQPPVLDSNQAGRVQVQVATSVEIAEEAQPDDSVFSDKFTLSGAGTPVKDKLSTEITQMEAADIESEFNDLLTIEQQSPASSITPSPSVNPEPRATNLSQDPLGEKPAERKCKLMVTDYIIFKQYLSYDEINQNKVLY